MKRQDRRELRKGFESIEASAEKANECEPSARIDMIGCLSGRNPRRDFLCNFEEQHSIVMVTLHPTVFVLSFAECRYFDQSRVELLETD